MTRRSPLPAAALAALLGCHAICPAQATDAPSQDRGSRAERLRGAITPERAFWDVLHYDLAVQVLPETRTLKGQNTITFRAVAAGDRMQIDLQPPLAIDRVTLADKELAFEREGKVYWVTLPAPLTVGSEHQLVVRYGGKPLESRRPPWSGGLSWQQDDRGNHFIATTCQGIGASIWWPNKDHGYDEPDRGVDLRITVPAGLVAVGNGRLVETTEQRDAATTTYHWRVTNPINNYCVNVNIGDYVSIPSTYQGEGGALDVTYWVLKHQRERAEQQFREVPRTLAAFEHWFGKYPFYEDSYKLVCVPYLGMEHQSSVTYGNGFQNGYRGRDLSGTGVGMKFDFIVVHESAHEWWGNNISMQDVADMWIHESFANYAENLFVEYHFTEQEAQDYVIGCRKLIRNDQPIIGTYGLNRRGSGDMYYKGGNMLHTMRHMLDDDVRWRSMLRGLNREFWHRTVTTAMVEQYISEACGFDFGKVFDQYLRTTDIPELHHEARDGGVAVWLTDVVDGFEAPVLLHINGAERRVTIGAEPRLVPLDQALRTLELDRNFYMRTKAR